MKKILLCALIYFSVGICYASHSPIIQLMNQRMTLMKDVAGYKVKTHQAIEDLQQEQKVLLAGLEQAAQLGIDPQTIEPFIVAQMDIAKVIQYRYRANWLSAPETKLEAEDLNTVRKKIAKLSSELIQHIAGELKRNGHLHDLDPSALQHENLSSADKMRFIKTLNQIRLKQS